MYITATKSKSSKKEYAEWLFVLLYLLAKLDEFILNILLLSITDFKKTNQFSTIAIFTVIQKMYPQVINTINNRL